LWDRWPHREVFAHPCYVRLFAGPSDRVLCAAAAEGDDLILFPFILRPLAAEPWAPREDPSWDLVGPYGYGGVFSSGRLDGGTGSFAVRLERWLTEHSVVSSFVRLSLFESPVLPFNGDVFEIASNVVRDLTITRHELWRDYAPKVRKNVNRARRAGLTVELDHDGTDLDGFLEVYYATMNRCGATPGYYFPRSFFEAMIRDLAGRFVFAHVRQGPTLVSTELVLISDDRVYSFLGGTVPEAFPLRPGDLLKHELFLWARGQRKEAFVLGGGYSRDDGIYRYKRSFAPSGSVPFKVGTVVHDQERYAHLVDRRREWEFGRGVRWAPSATFFPGYRA
jgi:Acetyltransferase (GNAT) domain